MAFGALLRCAFAVAFWAEQSVPAFDFVGAETCWWKLAAASLILGNSWYVVGFEGLIDSAAGSAEGWQDFVGESAVASVGVAVRVFAAVASGVP
ncbi:hypothetical protein [Mycolicibacter algericus]|uniref:hypothetical protein n=1 Tax=Mycolicibacter algericus TaxID=1288388 RepID=UPI001054C38B|nr:hypothetical protein [Mycolicibacter algericus]